MPRDMFGAELGVGAFVAYPYATQRSQYGIITNLGAVRATIDNGISKYYGTLIECSDKLSEEQKERLRIAYAPQLNVVRRPPVSKFIVIRLRWHGNYNNHERFTDNDRYRYIVLEAEDGTSDSITRKINSFLDELNVNLQNIPAHRRWIANGYCKVTDGIIDPTRYETWSSGSMSRTKFFSTNLPIHLNRILTLDEVNAINAANR